MESRYRAAVEADTLSLADPPDAVAGARQLVDVRRAQTYAQADDLLAGAVWRDPARLSEWSSSLDREAPVLVYCAHGHEIGRSVVLALRANGYDARFIAGGIEACREAGAALSPKA